MVISTNNLKYAWKSNWRKWGFHQPPRWATSNGNAGNKALVSSGFPAAILVRHQAASSNYIKIMTQVRNCQYIGLKILKLFPIFFKREIRLPLIAWLPSMRRISICDDSVDEYNLLTEAAKLCENITNIWPNKSVISHQAQSNSQQSKKDNCTSMLCVIWKVLKKKSELFTLTVSRNL